MTLPEPQLPDLAQPWNVLVTGIGGTGVLTVSSVLAMAAHIEGKGCATLNQTGLAQKFGSVISHVRIGKQQDDIHAVRIAAGDADLLLGCDLVVSASDEALAKLHTHRSHAIVNDNHSPTAEFITNPDAVFPSEDMKLAIESETGDREKTQFVSATAIATALLGDSIAANLFLLGYAWQSGLIPVSSKAIEEAIELNNVAVDFNTQAFMWGRRAAFNLDAVLAIAKINENKPALHKDLGEIIQHRMGLLTHYQDRDYAELYQRFIDSIQNKLSTKPSLSTENRKVFLQTLARNLFKLMAYKDEYEVARLYSNGEFIKKLEKQFQGNYKLQFHLAPPILSKKDAEGKLIKKVFPQWTMLLFGVLAKLRFLRGSIFDVFGYTQERQLERQLIDEYKNTINELLEKLDDNNYEFAMEIAALPEYIRGFGHVKLKNINQSKLKQKLLLDKYHGRNQKSHKAAMLLA
jgi:indolepyruvate ferredoxin oxidoreductase